MYARLTVVVAALALTACAQVIPPGAPAPVIDRYAHAPFDTVWHRTVIFFTDAHVPIQNVDKSSGLITSARFSMPFEDLEAWGDCGQKHGGGSTIAELKAIKNYPTAYANFNVVEQGSGDSVAVRASIEIEATVGTPGGTIPLRCVSNGKFEADLFARVSRT